MRRVVAILHAMVNGDAQEAPRSTCGGGCLRGVIPSSYAKPKTDDSPTRDNIDRKWRCNAHAICNLSEEAPSSLEVVRPLQPAPFQLHARDKASTCCYRTYKFPSNFPREA